MAYKLRYFCDYEDYKKNKHRWEFYEKTEENISPVEVTGLPPTFSVEWPEFERLEPVCGSGCVIRFLGRESETYWDLFTSDIKHFLVKHYSGGVMNWCGYVDTELYNEDFAVKNKYDIELTGNDGLNILERFPFLKDDEKPYCGMWTIWDLLTEGFKKIGLPYKAINVSNKIKAFNSDGQEMDMLKDAFVNAANFYDEDGEPMNFREVFEELLKALSSMMIISNTSVYIFDLESFVKDELEFRQFNASTFEEINAAKMPHIVDVDEIGFSGSEASLSIKTAFNSQSVEFDPYMLEEIYNCEINTPDIEDLYNEVGSLTVFGTFHDDKNYRAWVQKYDGHPSINIVSELCDVCKLKPDGDHEKAEADDIEYYLAFKAVEENEALMFKNKVKTAYVLGPQFLNIDFEYYAKRSDSYLYEKDFKGSNARALQFRTVLKIGEWYCKADKNAFFNRGSFQWVKEPSYLDIVVTAEKDEGGKNINDKWNEVRLYYDEMYEGLCYGLEIPAHVHGEIEFGFTNYVKPVFPKWEGESVPFQEWPWLYGADEIWLRDIRLKLSNRRGRDKDYNTDSVEYIIKGTKSYKDEGPKIDFKVGTYKYRYNNQLGALYFYNSKGEYEKAGSSHNMTHGYLLNGFERSVNTHRTLEELYLASSMGNNRTPSKMLQLQLKSNFDIINLLTCKYLPNLKLMFLGGRIEYEYISIEGKWCEVRPDELITN